MSSITGTKSITIKNYKFELLPQKAVFNEKESLLIIADPHFGKSAAFRRAGIAVPEYYFQSDLKVLNDLIMQLKIRRLIILGDFFHAKSGITKKVNSSLYKWRKENQSAEIILVRGNHDKSAGLPEEKLNIYSTKDCILNEKFLFTHKEENQSKYFNFCGHIHPAVNVKVFGSRVTLPCFYFTEDKCFMPAFGTFTGTYKIKPEPGSKTYVIADESVVKLK